MIGLIWNEINTSQYMRHFRNLRCLTNEFWNMLMGMVRSSTRVVWMVWSCTQANLIISWVSLLHRLNWMISVNIWVIDIIICYNKKVTFLIFWSLKYVPLLIFLTWRSYSKNKHWNSLTSSIKLIEIHFCGLMVAFLGILFHFTMIFLHKKVSIEIQS